MIWAIAIALKVLVIFFLGSSQRRQKYAKDT